MFKTSVFSRHPSHKILRTRLPKLPVRSLIRLGSTTEPEIKRHRIEINSIESIKVSANKRLMKEAFDSVEAPTARWTNASNVTDLLKSIEKERIRLPIVAKAIYGSRGKGNSILHNKKDVTDWAQGKTFSNYIFENYMPFLLEFRLHVTKNGCFYACRKALKKDTADKDKWHRHIDNSVWLLETNPEFNRPNSWNDIVKACVRALQAVGADILSFDVKVQGATDQKGKRREYQEFILLECNSASSLQSPQNKEVSVCASKYLEVIPKIIMEKAGK